MQSRLPAVLLHGEGRLQWHSVFASGRSFLSAVRLGSFFYRIQSSR